MKEHKGFITELGELFIFIKRVFKQSFSKPFAYKELSKQLYSIGNKTLLLVAITGFIMGMVLTMQTRPMLVTFGVQSLIPSMVSISVFREIGPVVTALICAGKISSGIGAEIGAMKVTEQIDAMEVSGTNPIGYVVTTRVIATTIMIPLLVFFSDACSLMGSYIAYNFSENLTLKLFIQNAFSMLFFTDVIPATIKTIFFGFFIGIIGAFKGYKAGMGTESVGWAANSAVVTASLSIFLVDLIFVLITDLITKI